MPPKNNSCLKTASIGKRTTSTVSNNKKNSTTEPLAVNDNLPTTRKRGRSQATKAVDETVIVEEEEKKGIKATDTVNKEGVVNDLNVSSSSTTAAGTDKPDNEEEEQPPVVKRKRGRPANKNSAAKKVEKVVDPSIPKRGRGRPKKVTTTT